MFHRSLGDESLWGLSISGVREQASSFFRDDVLHLLTPQHRMSIATPPAASPAACAEGSSTVRQNPRCPAVPSAPPSLGASFRAHTLSLHQSKSANLHRTYRDMASSSWCAGIISHANNAFLPLSHSLPKAAAYIVAAPRCRSRVSPCRSARPMLVALPSPARTLPQQIVGDFALRRTACPEQI